jgi:hypothetical protein
MDFRYGTARTGATAACYKQRADRNAKGLPSGTAFFNSAGLTPHSRSV